MLTVARVCKLYLLTYLLRETELIYSGVFSVIVNIVDSYIIPKPVIYASRTRKDTFSGCDEKCQRNVSDL